MTSPADHAATVRRYLDDAYPLDSAAHTALAALAERVEPMTSPADHAATVQVHYERVLRGLPEDSPDYAVIAARDSARALAERATELERQWPSGSTDVQFCMRERKCLELRQAEARATELERDNGNWQDIAKAAEARTEQLERERDRAEENAANFHRDNIASRMRAEQLETALRDVMKERWDINRPALARLERTHDIARAALDGGTAT